MVLNFYNCIFSKRAWTVIRCVIDDSYYTFCIFFSSILCVAEVRVNVIVFDEFLKNTHKNLESKQF